MSDFGYFATLDESVDILLDILHEHDLTAHWTPNHLIEECAAVVLERDWILLRERLADNPRVWLTGSFSEAALGFHRIESGSEAGKVLVDPTRGGPALLFTASQLDNRQAIPGWLEDSESVVRWWSDATPSLEARPALDDAFRAIASTITKHLYLHVFNGSGQPSHALDPRPLQGGPGTKGSPGLLLGWVSSQVVRATQGNNLRLLGVGSGRAGLLAPPGGFTRPSGPGASVSAPPKSVASTNVAVGTVRQPTRRALKDGGALELAGGFVRVQSRGEPDSEWMILERWVPSRLRRVSPSGDVVFHRPDQALRLLAMSPDEQWVAVHECALSGTRSLVLAHVATGATAHSVEVERVDRATFDPGTSELIAETGARELRIVVPPG